MKYISKKCAMCGAERTDGSTLCEDCIIAFGGGRRMRREKAAAPLPLSRVNMEIDRDDYIIEGNYFMEMYKNGRKCAEIDVAGWTPRQVAQLIDIERFLSGRSIKINRVNTNR